MSPDVRFHVHKDGLTGYVISIEGASPAASQGETLEFKLRDVFTVKPQSAPGSDTSFPRRS
jgi:hypothetical protein